jgi:transposase
MNLNNILEINQFNALALNKVDGEVIISGELVNTCKSCDICNTEPEKPHQYHKKKIRTVAFNGIPTYLVFTLTAYLCPTCGKRYLERTSFFEKHKRYTKAYEKYIYELAKKQDIERVAQLEGLSWDTVNDIFLKVGKRKRNT